MAAHEFNSPILAQDGGAGAQAVLTRNQIATLIAAVTVSGINAGKIPSSSVSDFTTAVNALAQAKIDALLNGAGTAFDTLKEIQDAFGGDPNALTTAITNLGLQNTRISNLEADSGGAQSFTLGAITANTPVTLTHGKARRMLVQVYRVSDNQQVFPVITSHPTNGTCTVDFGSLAAAAGTYVVLVK